MIIVPEMTSTDENAASSLQPQSRLTKENDDGRITQIEDDDFFSWRDTASDPKPSSRSKGISPKAFHSNRRQRPGEESVRNLHNSVQQSLLKEEKRKVIQDSEVKRSAFKQLTSLRTWPIQSRAFQHWKELMDEYMHDGGKWNAGADDDVKHSQESQISDSSDKSAGSLSTTSSGISIQEPKRILRDTKQSPAKSKLKNQYRSEFENERSLSAPLSPEHKFGSPLWSMEPRIFSSEKSGTGKRKYVVGHLGRFLDLYWRKVDPQHRFYYELIRENTPCRLYLDLEFAKNENPEISSEDAEMLLDELFLEIKCELKDQFGIDGLTRSNVVDLESSTETKFSRHWIVHLPDQQLFANTAAVGHFMQQLTSRIADDQATGNLKERGRPLLQKYFLVNSAPSKADNNEARPKQTCFIDCGVYTRNRLFRILGSQKFGKPPSAALRIANKNTFPFPEGFSNALFYLPDMQRKSEQDSSGVTDASNEILDQIENAVEDFVAATDWNSHAEALAQTLVVPVNWAKVTYPILPFDRSLLEESGKPNVRISSSQRMPSSMNLSVGASPYPLIDDFVVNHLGRRGGIQGSIRAWSVVDAPSKGIDDSATAPAYITYQMSRNRWCECIGRAHRSNNIQWTVDLRLWHCVQSCHDPECRLLGFRGTPVPVPMTIREQVEDQIFEEQLLRLDEATLIAKARSAKDNSASQTLQSALSSLSINEDTDEKAKGSNPLSSFEQSEEDAFEEQLLRLEETVTSALENASSQQANQVLTGLPEPLCEEPVDKRNLFPSMPRSQEVMKSKPQYETDNDSSDDDIDLVAFLTK